MNAQKRARRGQVGKGMIIILVVLVIVSGGFWLMRSGGDSGIKIDPNAPELMFTMKCENEKCNFSEEQPYSKVRDLKRDEESGLFPCPKCGKPTLARYRKSGGDVVAP